MQPKIIFFDIDDTLYRKKSAFLPESIGLACEVLRQRGIKLGIATGRSPAIFPDVVRKLVEKYQFEAIVAINGQYCAVNGQEIGDFAILENELQEIITFCQIHDFPYCFVGAEAMSASADVPVVAEALRPIGDYLTDPNYHQNHKVYQILIFVNEANEHLLTNSDLARERFKMIRWHENSVDFLRREGSKARGIETVCGHLGIEMSETMAFGDGLNDIEMAQQVGFFVAMGDGRPELHAEADYITGTIEEDGIYNALKNLGIIS